MKLSFVWNFQGKSKKTKDFRVVFIKYVLNQLCYFFWNSPLIPFVTTLTLCTGQNPMQCCLGGCRGVTQFLRGVTQFCGVSMGEAFFCVWNFQGKSKKTKDSREVFIKVCPQPPLVFFSGIAH